MRKKMILSLLLLSSGLLRAEMYNEGVLYDLTGNVREMKLKTKNPYAKKHVKFNKDGKCKTSMTYFDTDLYPLGYELSAMKLNLSQKVDYDINKRVSSITNRSSQNGGITETITFFYPDDNSHEIEKSTFIIQSPKGNSGIECVFSAYEYDDKGNWIRRNVRQSTKNASNESESTEYTETRIITYYQ